MKILISSLTYPLRNGVTSSIDLSADGLLKAGHEVRIVAPEYDAGKKRPEHVPIPSSTIGQLFMQLFGKEERMFAIDARGDIEKVIEDFQPDIFWLHTVNWMPSLFERIMLDSDKGKVLTYHTLVEQYGRTYAGEIGAARMIRRSIKLSNSVDHVITPSHVIADKLRSYGARKPISVIATGITKPSKAVTKEELARRFNFSAELPLLLFVGRISKEKNISSLLKMAANLKTLRGEFTLLLVGPGDVEETIEEAKVLGLEKNVVTTGALNVEDSKACYAAADVFVFASQTETQGLVIGEAMIANTPVVALKSPIQSEIYPSDVAVVIDKEKDFANKVNELLDNPEQRQNIIEKAQKFVTENFSCEVMTNRQLAVFESVVKSTPLARRSPVSHISQDLPAAKN